jgi:HEAT repeat protein
MFIQIIMEVVMIKSTVLLTSVFILVLAIPAMAGDSVLPPNADKTLIEDNLFLGLANDNLGLQRSCALMLGEIKSDRAVVPLMAVLHNSSDDNFRVAAAWALCKIGDARGVYAVKMAVKYDENTKVQAICAWYYDNLVKQGTFMFAQPELPTIATAE